MKQTYIHKLFKILAIQFLKFINRLTPKVADSLFFIPHRNCLNDNYDIINNKADNVLLLCDSILRDERFNNCDISLMVYDVSKVDEYIHYCNSLRYKRIVNFIPYNDRMAVFKAFCRSSIILTDNYYTSFWYKVKCQTVICLGYFVLPFKDDFIKIKIEGYPNALRLGRLRNKHYDYHISTSRFCSRELSVDSLLYLPKYKDLGFPRNDIFFEDCSIYRKKLADAIGFSPKIILSFVPTHRDYENQNHYLFDKANVSSHSLFGYITKEEEVVLEQFLESEDMIIVAKAHPIQEKSVITKTTSKRIFYFSDLNNRSSISLQEIMAASDLMATDYSTACFDFLLTDRPAIYYFYDYEIERNTRTFFIDPIEPICAGDIVFNIKGFIDAVKLNIENPDRFADKRHFVRDLIFSHNDGNATARGKQFILELLSNSL